MNARVRNRLMFRLMNLIVVAIAAVSFSCIDLDLAESIVSSAGRPALNPSFELVGEDTRGSLIFAIWDDAASSAQTGEPGRSGVQIVAFEPRTQSSEIITGNIDATWGKLASNGTWTVWEDLNSGQTLARNLQGGEDRVLLNPGQLFGSPKIFDNRAVLLRRSEDFNFEGGAQGFTFSFLIVDLEKESSVIVDDVWSYGTVALMGDTALVMTHASVDTCCLELGAAIDAIDLTTGRRSNVVRRTRVEGGGGEIFLAEDTFVWQEFADKKLSQRVRTYNPAVGTLKSLNVRFNDLNSSESWLDDVSGDRLLMRDSVGSRILGQSTKYRVWSAHGSEQTVLEFANTRIEPQQFRPNVRLVGPWLIWADPFNGDLLIKDLVADSSERLRPQDLVKVEHGNTG